MNFIEQKGRHSVVDGEGNIIVGNNDIVLLSCSNGEIVQINEDDISFISAVQSLIPEDISENKLLNLGDLRSPFSVICDNYQVSPQR